MLRILDYDVRIAVTCRVCSKDVEVCDGAFEQDEDGVWFTASLACPCQQRSDGETQLVVAVGSMRFSVTAHRERDQMRARFRVLDGGKKPAKDKSDG